MIKINLIKGTTRRNSSTIEYDFTINGVNSTNSKFYSNSWHGNGTIEVADIPVLLEMLKLKLSFHKKEFSQLVEIDNLIVLNPVVKKYIELDFKDFYIKISKPFSIDYKNKFSFIIIDQPEVIYQNLGFLYSAINTVKDKFRVELSHQLTTNGVKLSLRFYNIELPKREKFGDIYLASLKSLSLFFSSFSLKEHITRTFTIDPRYRQTIVGTINYFSEIIDQKFPDENIYLNINQSGKDTIKFSITAEDGKKLDSVEKALDDYDLVLRNEKPVEELLPDPIERLKFENKVEMLAMELRNTNKLLSMKDDQIVDLKQSAEDLRKNSEDQKTMISQLIELNSKKEETISSLIKTKNRETTKLLKQLDSLISQNNEELNETEIKTILEELQEKDSTTFNKILDFARGAATGATGRYLYEFAEIVRGMWPV